MVDQSAPTQYVLLPLRGAYFRQPEQLQFLQTLNMQTHAQVNTVFDYEVASAHPVHMRVLDQVHEDGIKLVEMTPQSAHDLQMHQPTILAVPVVYYYPAVVIPELDLPTLLRLQTTIRVVSIKDGSPIVGATVIWVSSRVGGTRDRIRGVTDTQGTVSFPGPSPVNVERLLIYVQNGFWPFLKQNFVLKPNMQFEMTPLDLTYVDGLRYFYKNAPMTAGQGIQVGVIDTGIAPHPDLLINGGANTVTGEDPNDFGDNGAGHGTHVAGIIAARGTPPTGIRGVAPGVTLRSYRVFGQGSDGATNFAIAKAIDLAVAQGCDLINMSLGGAPADPVLQAAIDDANSKGTVMIVAAGNDGRQPVAFPASYPPCIAVSAMGRIGTFPTDAAEQVYIADPHGKETDDFIASFSNIGSRIQLTAPGVGIISTYPGGYAVLDGTSMATPAATGAAARILEQLLAILAMPRDQARAAAMIKAILSKAQPRGFGLEFEGNGLLMV